MVVGPDMVAHERKIEVGVRQGEKVQILSGLKPGEQVITVGGVGLEDGAKVRIGAAKAGKDEGESKGKGGKDEDEK
jgi:multidrug efflux pump subunit AcrA (membrane-fusion protein)